jgi:hypothetical protein
MPPARRSASAASRPSGTARCRSGASCRGGEQRARPRRPSKAQRKSAARRPILRRWRREVDMRRIACFSESRQRDDGNSTVIARRMAAARRNACGHGAELLQTSGVVGWRRTLGWHVGTVEGHRRSTPMHHGAWFVSKSRASRGGAALHIFLGFFCKCFRVQSSEFIGDFRGSGVQSLESIK